MVSRLQPVFRASWARKMPTCCSMKIPLESVVATEPTLRITQLEQGIQAMVSTPEAGQPRSEEHTSELQSLMRISYAVFCLKKKISTHKNAQERYEQTHHIYSIGTQK